MNAARRARQKANHKIGGGHTHLNREQRTDVETGEVTRCLYCMPQHHINEKAQGHAGMIFRPVQGKLTWAQQVVSQMTKGLRQDRAEMLATKMGAPPADLIEISRAVSAAPVKKPERTGQRRNG